MSAESHWRKLRGKEKVIKVMNGIVFKDGEEIEAAA